MGITCFTAWPVQYFVGDLDAEHCKFTWEKRGYVDRSTHFYATNVIPDEKTEN